LFQHGSSSWKEAVVSSASGMLFGYALGRISPAVFCRRG
jgi:hypothetical protein